jgi:hypothetical protein
MADVAQVSIEATAAGIGAVTMAIIGVEPQAVLWGSIGACVGMTFAAPAGRLRASLMFVAVVLACAELGTWASIRWFDASFIARNSVALVLGMLFHPILAAVVARIPIVVNAIAKVQEKT